MKKSEDGFRTIRCPYRVLYRDQLQEVIDTLADESATIKITSGDYEYESLDELQGHRGPNPSNVTILGQRSAPNVGFLEFAIWDRQIDISASGSLLRTAYVVKATVDSRSPVVERLARLGSTALPGLLLGLTAGMLLVGSKTTKDASGIADASTRVVSIGQGPLWLGLGIVAPIMVWAIYRRTFVKGVLLRRQHEAVDGFRKQLWPLLFILLGAALGKAVEIGVGALLAK